MYRVFAGFEVPEALIPIVNHIDRLVVTHGGPVVRRKHPLHVTVMAPRTVCANDRHRLVEFVEEFNTDHTNVPCTISALVCHEHRNKKFFVADLAGQQLFSSIGRFHQELERRFSWTRGEYEGTKPHVTLISSKNTYRKEVFERVTSEARSLQYPREAILLPRMILHVRKEGSKQSPQPLQTEEPHTGWRP